MIDNICHVGRLVVSPKYQGLGIATKLMIELESYFRNKCKTFEIFTGEKSIIPLTLYTKLGYKKTHEIQENDYSIIFMRKENCMI